MKKFMQLFERLVVAVEKDCEASEELLGSIDGVDERQSQLAAYFVDLEQRLDKLEAACFDHFQLQRHTRKQKSVEEIVAEHADPR